MKTAVFYLTVMLLVTLPALAQDPGWVGISIEDQRDGGALVRRVEPNSPAERAGVKEGDVVLEFNKQAVVGVQQLSRLVRETPVGRTVEMKVRRGNAEQTLKVTTDRASAFPFGQFRFNGPGDVRVFADGLAPRVRNFDVFSTSRQSGIQVESLSDQLRDFFGVRSNNGVLVTSVARGSPAEKAGLKAGDVITMVDGRDIRNAGEFSREIAGRSRVTLKIVRNKQEQELKIE